jgi:hypothetical protein
MIFGCLRGTGQNQQEMQRWKTEIACKQGSGTSISGNVPSQCRALNLSTFIYNVTMELSIILN